MHTGFACSLCDKSFINTSYLDEHQAVHNIKMRPLEKNPEDITGMENEQVMNENKQNPTQSVTSLLSDLEELFCIGS